jgi:D-glycero-D-manno-heptose 1,7-bisphosphate phosphatase
MQQQKALFLDRDGVININHGYVFEPEKVDFIDGIFDLIARFINAGYIPIIVTNQSGIVRGYYTEQQFFDLMHYIQQQFDQHKLPKIPVYFCPHHPDFVDNDRLNDCYCRKPKPGMIIEASTQLNIDLSQSVFVGDNLSDMLAAKRANVRRKILFDPQRQQTYELTQSGYANELSTHELESVLTLDSIEV